jgi:hypothetical protein
LMHFFNTNEGIVYGAPATGNPAIDSLRIYRTSNGGDSWERVVQPNMPALLPDEGHLIYGVNSSENHGDTLWFGTSAGRVFRTTDKGISWDAFVTGISGGSYHPGISSVAFRNHLEGLAITYSPSNLAKTSDGGSNWTVLPVIPWSGAADIFFLPGTANTYIVSRGMASYLRTFFIISYDGGLSWDTAYYDPVTYSVRFLSPTLGFGGGRVLGPNNGGVYKWIGNLSMISKKEVIYEYSLFPNPCSDVLTVKGLKPWEVVAVKIVDIQGRSVAEFNNISCETYEINLKSLITKSGSYFLIINSPGKEEILDFIYIMR